MSRREQADYFNVDYGAASAVITTTGGVAIATTEAAYHGIEVVAGDTVSAIITIYDSVGGASGNILARINVQAQDSVTVEKLRPIMAKKGIYIVATGVGMSGTIFYGPKG